MKDSEKTQKVRIVLVEGWRAEKVIYAEVPVGSDMEEVAADAYRDDNLKGWKRDHAYREQGTCYAEPVDTAKELRDCVNHQSPFTPSIAENMENAAAALEHGDIASAVAALKRALMKQCRIEAAASARSQHLERVLDTLKECTGDEQ